jgi:hypothetical protein
MNDKEYALKQYRAMDSVFQNWKPLYKEVRDFIYPYLGTFDGENDYDRHDEELLRTKVIKYANVMAAGMKNGLTSSTRKWAKLSTDNPDLNKQFKDYFEACSDIMMAMLTKGGFYQEILKYYLEIGIFGTAAIFTQEDPMIGVTFHTFTMGEYCFGCDAKGKPNAFARKFKLNGDQLASMFGGKPTGENGMPYNYVLHVIAPNPDYEYGAVTNDKFPFVQYYLYNDKCVKSGYHEFPVSIGRWLTKGKSIWGTGPGIWSLGDSKQLQVMWRDMDMGAELMVKPPVQGPSDIIANGGINLMPGSANYYNPVGNSDGAIKPIWTPRIDFTGTATLAEQIEDCVKEHFNYNVFQLLSDMDKGTRTAREIVELSSEKMGQMGPIVDKMETEILPAIINRVVAIGFRNHIFPEPPQELQGIEYKIEYNSILSQAQRQSDITPIVDTVNLSIQMANTAQKPEILDKIDFDKAVDLIADRNGTPSGLIKSDDEVAQIRLARAQQQQMQQAAAMAQQSADIAKTASQAKLTENSALTQVLGGVAGNE